MKKICVVTSSRADFGILQPLLKKLAAEQTISLSIVATGSHLVSDLGYTYQEIEQSGFAIEEKIDIHLQGDLPADMSRSMGRALILFADYFEKIMPDLLIVLGDRYEIAAVCCAALNQRIPIAHLHGGEITEGAIDDCYRHAISKMSSLHFTSCEEYRKRVIQMGEPPGRVFNVGALGVENILHASLLTLEELEKSTGFVLSEKPFAVVTFHPVTMEDNTGAQQLGELTAALDEFPDMRFIITKANVDAGGQEINRLWEGYAGKHGNCYFTASLGMQRYLSALKYSSMVIGNSSSGILEGPASKIPTVNIGDRQKGRIMADSIINCQTDKKEIVNAIKTALTSDFQNLAKNVVNPYGDGHTSEKIVAILKEFLLSDRIDLKKKFYDIDFEVPK